ncbi:GPI transamidase component Gpi16p [[Candida] railenensis]|uniref:GPI transamidase component Gpi16p n=1 Tax=[Candida] railenensis TaxID=45579 RepID=A0A9P0W0P3_9ASCO|nr:GPI transamidase component Gpi16p [[Candida] railenensis]
MLVNWFVPVLLSVVHVMASYNETLYLKPLPRNKLMASWDFDIESNPKKIEFHNESISAVKSSQSEDHFADFPRALGPIIQSTNTRELHIRFTQGWWDSESWGKLPKDGLRSGGTGVELWAIIEAGDIQAARKSWNKLTNSLSGFFCASLNFIDDSITTFPQHQSQQQQQHAHVQPLLSTNRLYLLRASLPSEPICTENLTPYLKLLPSRGKAGISSLLEGHKVFDSLWHGMSIDIESKCVDGNFCSFSMHQSVNSIVDVIKSMNKKENGGIPRPTPGEELRCDPKKINNIWQCFPLNDPTELTWELGDLLGRKIKGPALTGTNYPISNVIIDVDKEFWKVRVSKFKNSPENEGEVIITRHEITPQEEGRIHFTIDEACEYDFMFETSDSEKTSSIEQPPLKVSRSLSGYSQGQGGFRISFKNPSDEKIKFVYFEVLPWYMRLYFNTMSMEITSESSSSSSSNSGKISESDFIKSRYYKPAIDRKRPSHLELTIELPPHTTMTLNYQFDKSLLLYAEYPPDANHGFAIEPAVITVLDLNTGESAYQLRTTSLLVTLPTPDFSMPYNVIILTSTVMALVFGSVFNLLIRRVVTEEELEKLASKSKLSLIVGNIKSKINSLTKKK